MKTFQKQKFITGAALFLLIALGAGCGKQEFAVQSSVETQTAPGTFEIPAKADILLGWDNTGSMYSIYNQVTSQIPSFLGDLESRGWDYHFAVTPLTTSRVGAITASRYDSNHGASWLAPYPGAQPGGSGTILASWFRPLSQFISLGFPQFNDVSNFDNGNEPAFNSMLTTLQSTLSGTNFLRPDAMLVLLVLSTGEDTSGISYCSVWPGQPGYENVVAPCPGSNPSDVSGLANQFKALKGGNAARVRFYSAVNQSASSNCLGDTRPRVSVRYPAMATTLNGSTIDVCQTSIGGMLSQLSSQLTNTRLAFRVRYLFISMDPEPSSIVVTRYLGGDPNQAIPIPQDAANGWSYDGYQTVYAIDYPTPMNQTTGFSIRLNGDSALMGNDTASVTFRPRGSQTTVTQ